LSNDRRAGPRVAQPADGYGLTGQRWSGRTGVISAERDSVMRTDRQAPRPLGSRAAALSTTVSELHVTRDNPNADLFVRLCDVDLRGRSRNVCDGIVRLTGADPLTGTVRVSLIGAAHRFGCGHRLRVQVAGGAHPRFARNPGNGQVDAPAKDFAVTRYSIGLGGPSPSALVLSAVSQTAGKAAAHA